MRTRFSGPLALTLVFLFARCCGVEACGPWFDPEVFVDEKAPDDLAEFAKGNLGILQAGFDSNEYAVAYRYLNGGTLSDAERTAYLPEAATVVASRRLNPDQVYDAQQSAERERIDKQPAHQWLAARSQFAPALAPEIEKSSYPTNYDGTIVFAENYLNCPDPAFKNAVLTLGKRAATWGKQSPWLIDWIRGQDAVFSNCAGKTTAAPSPTAPNAPALLQADRAYQAASAAFYAKQFDEAARRFAAIANDPNSPWKDWGTYLAARAKVRKAFAMGKATDPYGGELATYDPETMHAAMQMLQELMAQPIPKPSRTIVESELNFIRIRIEPEKRATEICAALAGPAPDPNFLNDLEDLSWLLSKETKLETPAPLLAWIHAWRGGPAAEDYASWQRTHALPGLMVALAKAGPSDSFAPTLVDDAAKIPPGSPAYDTAFYHRVRLLTALHRTDEARALLDARLPALRNGKPDSTLNALLGERMAVARDLNEFLVYAPRTALRTGSQGAEDLQTLCNEQAHAQNTDAPCPGLKQSLEFDQDAVQVLNHFTPLAQLIEAASSPSLPANLRQDVAIVAWTRAVLFEVGASAARAATLLPKNLRDSVGTSTGFQANLAILRNSGIRPYLEPGIPRVASFSTFDQLRDNWWCKPWDASTEVDSKPAAPTPPSFVSAEQQATANAEYQRLQQLPDSVAVIGQRVLDYAKEHPDDPHVPEALALTVRAGHYACQSWAPDSSGEAKSPYTPVSKAAFQVLHRQYPKSPWAAKTPYYY